MSYTREPWQDWTKEQWIASRPTSEQASLRTMSAEESDKVFLDWHRQMTLNLIAKNDQARSEGRLPPIKDTPQYGNHPASGAMTASSTDPYGRTIGAIGVGMMGAMGIPGRSAVGGFGGHGPGMGGAPR